MIYKANKGIILSLVFKQQQNIYIDIKTNIDINSKIKYNIILSPSLYWVKKVSLPIKHARDVKKIAHTLFEGTIPEDAAYSYHAYKKEDSFFVFAYDDKKILSLIESKGITTANINAIYFAQSELDTMQGTYKANDTEALHVKDGIVIVLPLKWFQTLQLVNVADLKPSKEKIKLQQFHHFIDSGIIVKAIVFLILLIVVFSVELFIYKHQKDQIVKQKDELFAKYHLKPTMMQNKAILSDYERVYKIQKRIRKTIASFLKANLNKDEKIEQISYQNKVVRVVISHVNKEDEKRIIAPFYQQKRMYKSHISRGKLYVEVTI